MKVNGETNGKTYLDYNNTLENWSKYAKVYDPIKCASIDGIDTEPHDKAVIRALNSTYKPNRFVKGRPECTIFVSRLNHDTSKETIKETFSKYGKIKRFRMVKDIVTGMPKGYAFVEFEEEQAAEDAYRLANKTAVDGNLIFVDFECERLLKDWKPRRLGGGFAGKKESGQLRFGGRDRPFKKPIALELKEKQEQKQREKKRRREDEQRHRREKSREKHKRRSPLLDNATNALPKSRTKHESPLRDNKAKLSLPVREKEISRSPPRKVARLKSPVTETLRDHSPPRGNTKKHSPQRGSTKQHSPQRDTVKRRSPPRENIRPIFRENAKSTYQRNSSHHYSTQENAKRYFSPKDKTRVGSPVRKTDKQYTPLMKNDDRISRENLRHNSPPRENIRNYSSRQENDDKYFDTRGETIKPKHYSPVRDQNIRHLSPSQNHFRANIRENDRRRLSPHRNDLSHPPARRPDNFFPREDIRYRSPVQEDLKRSSSPHRNERHFSPSRENERPYFPPNDNVRYRSPVRENIARRTMSPQMRTNNRRSPEREFSKHYSPPGQYNQLPSSREVRHHSPTNAITGNFQIQHKNSNYPPPYYSGPPVCRDFSPVRENTRPFSPSRDVRQPSNFRRLNFPPPRENARYFPPARENNGQYFHTEDDSHYPSTPDPGNYDYFPQEQNSATFPSAQHGTQFSPLRNSREWPSNLQNRDRRFPSQRGKYRGSFKRY